jgi:hypothetical protein
MNKFRGDFRGSVAYKKAIELLNIIEEIREHLHDNLLPLDEETIDTLNEVEHEIKLLKKDF